MPLFSGIASVSYFWRKHKIFGRDDKNAAVVRAKKTAPLTKIREAAIMSIEKVLTSKRLAPYQNEIKKKMTALSWGTWEAVIFSCVYHRRETQSM